MDFMLYSFDIFDTLITRTTATPDGVFAVMQQKLLREREFDGIPLLVRKNFYGLRVQAEKLAGKYYCRGETAGVDITRIYEALSAEGGLKPGQTALLMELELLTEKECSVPIWENIEKLRELKSGGKRVILISDMYWKEEQLREILLLHDRIFKDIPLYVSSAFQRSKATGRLFQKVKEREGAEFQSWKHYGDHAFRDIKVPLKLGMQAERFPYPPLLLWEQEMLKNAESDADLQLLIGTARNCRMGSGLKHTDSFPWNAGSSYSAPLLISYVFWLLSDSIGRGVKHLFFIARDGYPLKKMADILIAGYKLPVCTHYLYGSRRAWRLPAVKNGNFELREFLRWSYPPKVRTIRNMAELFDLTADELIAFLPLKEGVKELYMEDSIKDLVVEILEQKSLELTRLISQKQEEKRERVLGYLKQEIPPDIDSFAFVEVIGSGYSQKCLADLLGTFRKEPVRTYFFRMDNCRKYDRNISHVFFTNQLSQGDLIEVLCCSNEGQTIDYYLENGRWLPVRVQDEGELLDGYGFQEYLEGIEEYTKEFVRRICRRTDRLLSLNAVKEYLDSFSANGDKTLFEYFCDMPYGCTGREKQISSYAPQISRQTFWNVFLMRRGEPVYLFYPGNAWHFSIDRLNAKQRRLMDFLIRLSESRCGKALRRKLWNVDRDKLNVYDFLEDRVILYGAGVKGRLLYRQLTDGFRAGGRLHRSEVCLWVDRDHEKYAEQGLPVEEPEKIMEHTGKQVIICVAKEAMMLEIKAYLIRELHVRACGILWVQPLERKKGF